MITKAFFKIFKRDDQLANKGVISKQMILNNVIKMQAISIHGRIQLAK